MNASVLREKKTPFFLPPTDFKKKMCFFFFLGVRSVASVTPSLGGGDEGEEEGEMDWQKKKNVF